MKIGEYVPKPDDLAKLNPTARMPFIKRSNHPEPYLVREEMVKDARKFGKIETSNIVNQELKKGNLEMDSVLFDDEASASLMTKQGLIREYTENLKNVDLHDLEQVMQELHQDRILQKYQYFVGNV